jgi:hypothetical protein
MSIYLEKKCTSGLAAKKTDEKEQTKRRSEGRGNRELLLVDR